MAANASLNTPYIILTGVVVLVVVFVFAVIQPLMGEIGQYRDQIASTEQKINERQEFLATIDRKLAQLQSRAQDEERLAVMLPSSEAIEDALRVLHQAGQTSGAELSQVRNNSSSSQSQITAKRARGQVVNLPADVLPLSFSIDYSGTYQQLRALLTELERSPRLMDVIKITGSRSTTQVDRITGEVVVNFYMQETSSNN